MNGNEANVCLKNVRIYLGIIPIIIIRKNIKVIVSKNLFYIEN